MSFTSVLGRLKLGLAQLGAIGASSSTANNITGVINIRNNVTKTQTGKVNVAFLTDQTQSGKINIKKTVNQTQTGKVFMQGSSNVRVTQVPAEVLLEGPTTANIRVTQTPVEVLIEAATQRTQTGVINIQVTTNRTQSGKVDVKATTAQTQTGKISMVFPTLQTQSGVIDIKKTVNQTQTGKVDIQKTVNQTQAGIVDIQATTNQTQTGKVNVAFQTTQTQDGKVHVKVVYNQTQTGKVNIQAATNRTQTGKVDVYNNVTRTQSGKVNVSGWLALSASDDITVAITDASAITTHDVSEPNDDLNISITDASTVTTTTVTPITTSDTLTVAITDVAPTIPHKTGLETDVLTVRIDESSSLAISTGVPGTPTPANPPFIALATPRAHATIQPTPYSGAQDALDTLLNTLQAAQWEVSGTVNATAHIDIFTLPITDAEHLHRTPIFDNYCWIDGQAFWFYDPISDFPDPTTGATYVVKGFDDGSPTGSTTAQDDSLANLIAKINSTTFSAAEGVPTSGFNYRIDLTSRLVGPSGNNHIITGNGSMCVGTTSTFGGYKMTSKSVAPDDLGGGTQTVLELRFTLGDTGSLMLNFKAGGVDITQYVGSLDQTDDSRIDAGYHMATQYTYQVYADPYQVLITPQADGDVAYYAGDIYVFNNSILFSSPYIVPEASVTSCGFVIGNYNTMRKSLQSPTVGIEIDGTEYGFMSGTSDPSDFGYSMLLWNQPTEGLKTWNSDPTCYQDAIVMLSKGQEQYKAVGYIYNMYMTTETNDEAPRGRHGTIRYDGAILNTFVLASNTDGTIATMYQVIK